MTTAVKIIYPGADGLPAVQHYAFADGRSVDAAIVEALARLKASGVNATGLSVVVKTGLAAAALLPDNFHAPVELKTEATPCAA